MVTARRIVAVALLGGLAALAACGREQQDWRSAEGRDTPEAYGQFIERHPDSELVKEARARIAQLAEDRDWADAAKADTAAAYQLFLTQHPAGKWAQEARIRVQNFSLAASGGQLAGAGVAETGPAADSAPAASGPNTLAVPGESAVPPGRLAPPASPSPTPPSATAPAASAPPAAAESSAAIAPLAASAPPVAAASSAATAASPAATAPLAANTQPAPTATPAFASSPAPRPNAYGIQLGAFTSEDRANAEWHALQARFAPQLQGLAPQVVAAETASGRVFRLQALGGDEARARQICEQLRERSQGCVPVIPH